MPLEIKRTYYKLENVKKRIETVIRIFQLWLNIEIRSFFVLEGNNSFRVNVNIDK